MMDLLLKNAESAFQAQKCCTKDERKKFIDLDPSSAKRLGRRVTLRTDWEDVKNNIKYGVVFAKFSQNHDLKKKLLETGDAHLEEGNTCGDRYWGTVNGKGKNQLGKILMIVRTDLLIK